MMRSFSCWRGFLGDLLRDGTADSQFKVAGVFTQASSIYPCGPPMQDALGLWVDWRVLHSILFWVDHFDRVGKVYVHFF